MSESEKPEGNIGDAEGVTVDSDGNPHLQMEVLQKGGSSDTNKSELNKESES